MFEPIFIDTETVGLHGVPVLIQWAEGDGPINLFSPWTSPVQQSLDLINKFVQHKDGLVFFNASFDWFIIYKWFTICRQLVEIDGDAIPEEHIDTIIDLEESGRDCPVVIRPQKVFDLFLHARKTEYQSTMDRRDVVLRRIPSSLAWIVAEELEKRVKLRDIYFARRKDKTQPKWQVQDRKNLFGEYDPDWKNVVLRFKPSSALKALAVDIGLATEDQVLRYGDISPKMFPVEFGYAPYARAAINIKMKNKSKERHRSGPYRNTWPHYIKSHILHWGYNELARKYAADDIHYTRGLFKYFKITESDMSDTDSELAIMVACVRWRGYRIDIDGVKKLKERARNKMFLINDRGERITVPQAPKEVKNYIMEVCDSNEKLAILQGDTKKVTLEALAKDTDWRLPCPKCNNDARLIDIDSKDNGQRDRKVLGCSNCKNTGYVKHEASIRATQILESRKAKKEEELYDKLLAAGRLHASLRVIGTLSGRMSGADGLNVQAVKNTFDVKSIFFFAWLDEVTEGGDFAGFEVTIAVAEYNDEELEKDLLTCEDCEGVLKFDQKRTDYFCSSCGSNNGKKIHALFGMFCFPPMTYEEIKATEKTDDDRYTKSKQAVFQKIYMGTASTMMHKLGIGLEEAEEANRQFDRKYKGVARAQQKVVNMFQSMRQPGGRGTKVEWHEPADFIETMFGFRRYFTLENRICKALFNLANNMPKAMKDIKLKVTRTDRIQTAGGAACSAIYSAAFNVQGHNTRAAGNHVIQGTGAEATKRVQKAIWDLQPKGEHVWLVQPLNIHDSVMTPVHRSLAGKVKEVVRNAVEAIREKVPLIKLPWEENVVSWADKQQGIVEINNQSGEIIHAYKNRLDVSKFGLNFDEVYRCLTKQISEYNGSGWRLMSRDEAANYKKTKSYRTV